MWRHPLCTVLIKVIIVFSWFSTLPLVLFLELLDSPIFHLFCMESLNWLKIDQRIHYKIISITYKTLQSRNPSCLHNLLRIQSDTCTCSSTLVTLKRPTVCSRLKITERSFTHRAPVRWNALPKEFRQPAIHSSHVIQFGSTPPLLGLSSSQFHSKLKTHLFHKSFLP